ncbi:cell division protein ZipA [Neiella marina]|uniref:Cell division protein ZipA n=1 Tax=Neiella holothuriorum TaxID=2870530 RepID=A0ABS7EIJ4_9GAMM|nr:cell division protein ZipA [Neiella holothuriorum]MBW8192145.1 cell division protein ZipA [Neiella holothuriorum]
MDEFRLVLIIAGAVGIAALLWHGLWSLRRQQGGAIGSKEKPLAEIYKEQKKRNRDDEGFDQLGVGQVRTVAGALEAEHDRQEPSFSAVDDTPDPEQVEFQLDQPEPALEEATTAEPSDTIVASEPEIEPEPEPMPEPEEVLILTVVAAPGDELPGADLLPSLLTLGFKFGEMGIFHRHEDSSGQGRVLFSLANMVKPGTFDVDNMESFKTPGISLFMTLPNAGEATQSFNMMLNAAQKLARELKGQVLDDTRSVLTNQKIRHYQERIREFERKRLIVS